jgi:hypothetical protein
VLESWDDKVCDDWESLDDSKLNCEEWLVGHPAMSEAHEKVTEYVANAFSTVDTFFS